jgi:hypothetical protein
LSCVGTVHAFEVYWPSKSEEYLAKAKECEKPANNIRDLETKSQWLNLAQQWRELAEDPMGEQNAWKNWRSGA